jgi:hypothetical protein
MSKKKTYRKLHNRLYEDDYNSLLERSPGLIEIIRELLEAGDDPRGIGREVRSMHPHKWIESKVIEGVAEFMNLEN